MEQQRCYSLLTARVAEITNARLIVLPDTGGMGMLPYIGAGIIMLCIAILLYTKTKKRKSYKKGERHDVTEAVHETRVFKRTLSVVNLKTKNNNT